jgi:prepilin-type processing-associated H-X9-DG protein/prepilin-type N-terminal cleavage/methylation domain-containing protein
MSKFLFEKHPLPRVRKDVCALLHAAFAPRGYTGVLGRGKRAFTLIELLTAVCIITVLAALVAAGIRPSLMRARGNRCLHNMREIGFAAQRFAADQDGRLPGSQHQGALNSWFLVLQPYLGGKSLFKCPEDGNQARARSFAMNDFLIPGAASESNYSCLANIPVISATLYLAEAADRYTTADHFHFAPANDGDYTPTSFTAQVAIERHNGAANYLFVDGHVESIAWTEVQPRLTNPGDRFINPAGNP